MEAEALEYWTTRMPRGMQNPNRAKIDVCDERVCDYAMNLFGASRGSVDGMAVFSASRGPMPSADGPGHPRIIHLIQNRLPCITKNTP